MIVFGLILTFANFCIAIWLMVFGKDDLRLSGWVLMMILAVNVMSWAFSRHLSGGVNFGQVVVQGISLAILLWLALITKRIWPLLVSAIFLLRYTFVVLSFSGVKVPNSYLEMLRAAVWVSIPVAVVSGEIWLGLKKKKTMWWTNR